MVRSADDETEISSKKTELEGIWVFCDLSYYTLEYRGNHFAYAVYNLSNDNCNDRTFAFSESACFTMGNEVVTDGDLRAKELNVTASRDGHANYDTYIPIPQMVFCI